MHFGLSNEQLRHFFFSQPHQPFFLMAFVDLIVAMAIFTASYAGIVTIRIDSTLFHAYAMVYLVFTPTFMGFLLTTFPKFNGVEALEPTRYGPLFSLLYFASILYLLGGAITPLLAFVGIILALGAQALFFRILLAIYRRSGHGDRHDSFWILVSVGIGLVAHLLFFASFFFPSLTHLAVQTSIYGYLFLTAFSVAQRMVPFFSHLMIVRDDSLMKRLVWLVALHIGLDAIYLGASAPIDAIIAWLVFQALRRWKLTVQWSNDLLWILQIALYWVPVAFLFSAVENMLALLHGPALAAVGLHALMLGFLFTIFIGFTTRVSLGHARLPMQTGPYETTLFYLTQLLVVARLAMSVVQGHGYNGYVLLVFSGVLCIAIAALWAKRFFPILIHGNPMSQG